MPDVFLKYVRNIGCIFASVGCIYEMRKTKKNIDPLKIFIKNFKIYMIIKTNNFITNFLLYILNDLKTSKSRSSFTPEKNQ